MIDRILASFIFFTRLPLWRLKEVSADSYKHVVEYWPLVGWLTGGVMAATFVLACKIMPPIMALIAAISCRVLLTGALHEDGLADFFDGMGGGSCKEKRLQIMKDSRMGTYGALGLILYYAMLIATLNTLPAIWMPFIMLSGDCFGKFCASFIVDTLPYARKAEDAKSKTIYDHRGAITLALGIVFGTLPLFAFVPDMFWMAAVTPLIVAFALFYYMSKTIQGYTGDCCGATFLLCELSFYITVSCIIYINSLPQH